MTSSGAAQTRRFEEYSVWVKIKVVQQLSGKKRKFENMLREPCSGNNSSATGSVFDQTKLSFVLPYSAICMRLIPKLVVMCSVNEVLRLCVIVCMCMCLCFCVHISFYCVFVRCVCACIRSRVCICTCVFLCVHSVLRVCVSVCV